MAWKKVISTILTLLLLFSMVIPAFAVVTSAWVNCSVNQTDNKVTVKWGGTPTIREIKIFRDGSEFEDFTNIPTEGNFSIIETGSGSHKYNAIAYDLYKSKITQSNECSVDGTGKPKIILKFKNHYDELVPKIDVHSYERLFDWVQIYNLGSTNLELSKIKIRYFYTIDGEPRAAKIDPNNGQSKIEASDERINANYQFSDGRSRDELVSSNSVYNRFTKMAQPIKDADYFCETYFLNTECKIYSEYNLKIQPSFHKINLENDEGNHSYGNYIRNYDLTNDYSYNNSENIAVYYDDVKIWGNDPSVIAPKNLSAEIYDFTKVKLNWTASPGADSYTVLRSESEDGIFSPIAKGVTATSYNDNIPMPTGNAGKTYYYKVVANYGKIVSDESNVVNVTAYRLFAPANLKAKLDGNSVDLSWTQSAGAHSYIVKRSDSENGVYSTIAQGVNGTAFTDSTITMPSGFSGKSYYYKVAAVCNSLVSDDSNSAGVTIPGLTLDAAKNLTATVSDFVKVTLKWDSSSSASSYTIMRSKSMYGVYDSVKSGVTGTSYEDILPMPANSDKETFYYKVVAVREGLGSSSDSNIVYATISRLGSPEKLTAELKELKNVMLKWKASDSASSYIVKRSRSQDGVYEPIASKVAGTEYTDVVGIPSGNTIDTYYYKVVAVYENGGVKLSSGESNVADVTVSKLRAPTNLAANLENFTNVKLTWNASVGATGYNVWKREGLDGTYITIATSGAIGFVGDKPYYVDKIPMYKGNSGKTYYYKVVAVCGTSESDPTDAVHVSEQKLCAPQNLIGKIVHLDAELKWTHTAGAEKYIVKRCETEDGTYIKIGETKDGTITNWTDKSITVGNIGKKFYYKVSAVNGKIENESDSAEIGINPWDVDCKIISKSNNNNDFVIGSYIPVSFSIEFKDDTVNPEIILSNEVGDTENLLRNMLNLEFVSKADVNGTKLVKEMKNNIPVDNGIGILIDKDKDNKIIKQTLFFQGTYKAGDVAYVEFVLRVKADENVLNYGIAQYYGKNYKLNFTIQGEQNGTKKTPESITIKIVKSNKLK